MVTWIKFRQGARPFVWAGVLVGTAAVLDFLPLFNVLGYDFCFALGLVTAVAASDVGHGVVVTARRHARPASTPRLVGEAMLSGSALLILPLVLSLANALRVRNCNLAAGLAFFALLPVATAIFAAVAGAAVAALVTRRWLGRGIALALPFLFWAWALVRLYREPAVFAFDPYGGYFPGPIYDEALRPPLALVWYRLANLTWLATLVALVSVLRPELSRPLRPHLRPLHRPALALGLAVASLVWIEARGRLGVVTTHADLARILPRLTKTRHFVVRSDSEAETDAEIALAAEDLEFRYHQLRDILGIEPSGLIRVYRFPSGVAKKEAVGAANTLYAKPWTREIFVNAERFPARRLRHELAHVFAAAFGDPVFGIALAWRWLGPLPVPNLASGLVEGIAEAADFGNPTGRSTLHQEAATLLALGKAPDLAQALGAGFSIESGPRAYTIAGSFCRFLLDRWGANKLRALYRSAGDFPAVYGQSLPDLERQWRTFLAAIPTDDSTRAEAEERFRRPAIFRKVCARELAARAAEARMRLGTAPAESVALMQSTCADDPDEPTFRLDLAEAQMAAGEAEQALRTLSLAQTSGALTRPLRNRAANLEATIHFHAGRRPETASALAQALTTASDDGDIRFAEARQRALADAQAVASLGRVLFGDERGRSLDPALAVFLLTEFARTAPNEALGPYLVGRQLAPRDPKLAAMTLGRACPDNAPPELKPLDAVFTKECRRLLGESAYQAGDLATARAAFEGLAQDADLTADRLRADDFLERIAWKGDESAPHPKTFPMSLPSGGSGGTTTGHDRSQVPTGQ